MAKDNVIRFPSYGAVANLLSQYAREHSLPRRTPQEWREVIKNLLRTPPEKEDRFHSD